MSQSMPLAEAGPALDGAAALLARAIKARPEWQGLAEARTALRSDPGMQAILARYREAFERWSAARARRDQLPGDDALELAESQGALQAHPLYRRQQEATAACVALLQEVNRLLSGELEMDFAANAAPRSGCCG